jgi:hypothetical protein
MSLLSNDVQRRLRSCAGLLVLMLGTSAGGVASSAVISLSTPAPAVTQGSEVALTVRASDLGAGGLSSYSFDLAYTGGVLAFDRVVDAMGMGNAFGLLHLEQDGVVSFADVSFDDAPSLISIQGSSVDLFTVIFRAVGMGDSAFALSAVSLADAFGSEVPFIRVAGSDHIKILPALSVPEPGTWSLLALGGLAVIGIGRRGSRAQH